MYKKRFEMKEDFLLWNIKNKFEQLAQKLITSFFILAVFFIAQISFAQSGGNSILSYEITGLVDENALAGQGGEPCETL